MAKVNREKIKVLAGEIKQALGNLRDYSHISMEKVLNDSTILGSIKYNLIVTKEQVRAPEDYADCFRILGEMDILKKDFAERLMKMARFRNLLVHLYWQVNNQRIYEILTKELDDFDRFLDELGKYLESL